VGSGAGLGTVVKGKVPSTCRDSNPPTEKYFLYRWRKTNRKGMNILPQEVCTSVSSAHIGSSTHRRLDAMLFGAYQAASTGLPVQTARESTASQKVSYVQDFRLKACTQFSSLPCLLHVPPI
jgi:hypothetical protein